MHNNNGITICENVEQQLKNSNMEKRKDKETFTKIMKHFNSYQKEKATTSTISTATTTQFSYDNFQESSSSPYYPSEKTGSDYCLNVNKFDKIHFHDLQLDKKSLLQKYFRNALIGPRSNIYENLCRGCNYGVFNARGPLCTFCECLVGGVTAIKDNNSLNSLTSTTTASTTPTTRTTPNIYENICEKCNQIYNNDYYDNYDDNDNCTCNCHEDNSNCTVEKKIHCKSEEHLDNVNKQQSQKILNKIKKSKSFSKTDKKNVLSNFFGNWKKPKVLHSSTDVSNNNNNKKQKPRKKSLEILHNVEGYDQVFHTQEIFDLQRMCELKRDDANCHSDQHIYGRLKLQEQPQQQQDQKENNLENRNSRTLPLLSQLNIDNDNSFMGSSTKASIAASISNSSACSSPSYLHYSASNKRPRVSRPRLLRLRSLPLEVLDSQNEQCNIQKDKKSQQEKHQQSIYLPDSVCQWMTVLRHETFYYDGLLNNADVGSCYPKSIPAKQEFLAYLPAALSSSSTTLSAAAELLLIKDSLTDKANFDNALKTLRCDHNISDIDDDYQNLIDEFKHNILAKELRNVNLSGKNATSNLNSSYINFNLSTRHNQKRQDILSRLNNTKDINIDNDDNSFVVERRIKMSTTNEKYEHIKLINNENNKFIPVNFELNNSTGISQRNVSGVNGLNNLDVARKRCGIHERNSEFVNDILNIFDHLLNKEKCQIINEGENYTKNHALDLEPSNDKLNEITQGIFQEPCVVNVKKKTNDFYVIKSGLNSNDALTNIDLICFIQHNYLSIGLNCLVIYYDKYLLAFLKRNHAQIESTGHKHLVRKFQIFYYKYARNNARATAIDTVKASIINANANAHANTNTKCHKNTNTNNNENVRVNECCNAQINGTCNSLQSELDLNVNYGNLPCMNLSRNESAVVLEEIQPKIYNKNNNTNNNNNNNNNNSNAIVVQQRQQQQGKNSKVNVLMKTSNEKITINLPNKAAATAAVAKGGNYINVGDVKKKLKIPPQVPKRDPKTHLCTKNIVKESSKQQIHSNSSQKDMKVSAAQNKMENSSSMMGDDGIYQSIWKFKTLGQVPETDYYDLETIHEMKAKLKTIGDGDGDDDDKSLISDHFITKNHCLDDQDEAIVDDHSAWETDDEFMFTTKLDIDTTNNINNINNNDIISKNSEKYDTVCSNHSSNSNYSSIDNNSSHSFSSNYSLSGSTVTGFASSSTATMASALSTNFTHPLLRSVGIFYSPTEKKLRAIIYNYDRVQSPLYFAKKSSQFSSESSGENGLVQNRQKFIMKNNKITTSAGRYKNPSVYGINENGYSESAKIKLSKLAATTVTTNVTSTSTSTSTSTTTAMTSVAPESNDYCHLIPDSVQAWKFLLLDVNYIEDEEDMIVSECEILRAQQIKEDVSSSDQIHQQNILQRFKSISSGNLIDLPIEDDKKTIAERMRNKLQRGVFKINARSPKSEKKTRNIFRRTETASLYLEDGLKPKFPIFGAALETLELNQTTQPNVPRFVIDCVDYIEHHDRIIQDGLYRACGNKFSIDELKQKLIESYVYDTKLLYADDIHTITSLLKQFFRELGAPLIPQETYERLGRNLNDKDGIETIRVVLMDMKEPNRSTLKFIIKHLTNVAAHSSSNRMNASNLAIVWGPCLLSANQIDFDIGRMNTFAKVLIENYERIFTYDTNERLVC